MRILQFEKVIQFEGLEKYINYEKPLFAEMQR